MYIHIHVYIYIYIFIYIYIYMYTYTYICVCVSTSLCLFVDTFLCMRRLGMDTAGFEPAEGGGGYGAFGTWSAPPLVEARNNSSWLRLAFVKKLDPK